METPVRTARQSLLEAGLMETQLVVGEVVMEIETEANSHGKSNFNKIMVFNISAPSNVDFVNQIKLS